MKLAVVAVRDDAAGVFGLPQFAQSLGFAMRGFVDEVNRSDPQNLWYRHPEHFDLYELGEYDDQGEFNLLPSPKLMAAGLAVARHTSLEKVTAVGN